MITSLQLKALFWLGVGAWLIVLWASGQPINAALLHPASLVLGFLILFVTAFEKWAWKIPYLYPWFVARPNLSGTYEGELLSQWIDPNTGKSPPPIKAYLTIWQTLSTIHVRQYTAESGSVSLVGEFVRSLDGKQELIFVYCNEPQLGVRGRSPIHYGGAKVSLDQETSQLAGSYWTDRKTIGQMTFSRISRQHCHSFIECGALPKKPKSKKRP